jgi:hypothetical protein
MRSERFSDPRVGDQPTELDSEQLDRIAAVPSGAAALAGTAVFLLLLAWVLIYLLVYLPRGIIG